MKRIRKFSFGLVILLSISASLWAEINVSNLSEGNQVLYNRNSLSVMAVTKGSGTAAAVPVGRYGAVAYGEYESHLDWVPYQGSREISKVDFLYLTGEDELAAELDAEYKRVRKLHIIGNVLGWGGIGVSVIGLIWMCASFDNDDNFMHATILSLGALGVSCIGIPFLCIKPKENIPVSFAVNLANSYNTKLVNSLR